MSQGPNYGFGTDGGTTGPTPAPTTSPSYTPSTTTGTTGESADARLYIEQDLTGKHFVRMTPAEVQTAVAAGRQIMEVSAQDVLVYLRQGELNLADVPPDVRAELGRLSHADPSIMTSSLGGQTPVGAGPFTTGGSLGSTPGQGGDTGFHLDPTQFGTGTVDPFIRDATQMYYDLYGVSPPQGYIEGLQTKYGNIYDAKAELMKQAEKDNAPGFAITKYGTAIDAANRYYMELYGVPPPTGMIESMFDKGGNLFSVQRDILSGAKGAPGYADVRFANEVSSGQNLYFSLWGRDAPPRYVENQINNGMNLWEMEKFERSKPAFMQTKVARDEMYSAAESLTKFLGMGY
jgi:hypothetical protein